MIVEDTMEQSKLRVKSLQEIGTRWIGVHEEYLFLKSLMQEY